MKSIAFVTVICLIAFLVTPNTINAHSGGTDKNGCHNDNKNGGYHCHNSKSESSDGLIVGGVIVAAGVVLYLLLNKSFTTNASSTNDNNSDDSIVVFSFAPILNNETFGGVFKSEYSF
jgi:hypothetical protein